MNRFLFQSSYSNFVLSTDFGVPLEEATMHPSTKPESYSNDESSNSSVQDAKNMLNADNASSSVKLRCWLHLTKLFTNSASKYNSESNQILVDKSLPIVLCGFSKGCIILNELCNELEFFAKLDDNQSNSVPENESIELRAFSASVKHLVWLDGGHSGQSNNWITRCEIIALMKQVGFCCYVYVTPYQIQSRKYWAVQEYGKFLQLLEAEGLVHRHRYYFEERGEDFDIHVHFELLDHFDTGLI